jgi:NAD(P)H-dependent FMN reductase
MKTLLIIWHSRTGGSAQLAEVASAGARAECSVIMRHAPDAMAEDLLQADGYLFVCPENLAAMSGEMKAFFDRCYYPVLGQIKGRPYASLICAGSDGNGAARQIERIATGWRLKPVATPLIICTHAQTAEAILAPKQIDAVALLRCSELGALLGAGLALGVY